MAGSYGHILVLRSTQPKVIIAVSGDPAYIATFGDIVAVFSESAVADTHSSALHLSAQLNSDIVGFAVFDDHVLGCVLCRGGETIAEVTLPSLEEYAGISSDELELMAEYLSEAAPNPGAENDPTGFVFGVGTGDLRLALQILDDDYGDGGRTVSACARQQDLLAALQLPEAVAGWDYHQFVTGVEGFEGPFPTHVDS